MSFITSCPACSTSFRVVPDQLKVSDGWVRCGQCGEVFDASLHLQNTASPDASSGRAASAVEPAAPPFEDARPVAEDTVEQAASTEGLDEAGDESTPPQDASDLPADGASQPVDLDGLLDDERPADTRAPVDASASLPDVAADAKAGSGSEPVEPATQDLHELSFVRQARARAFWSRPAVRASMAVVALVLLLLLAGQVTFHERDRIAAVEPRSRPWLEQACAALGCRIEPLRQIEWVAIDSSSFSKLRGDTYRLQLTMRNVSPFDLAMPAVELTLTDTQDQPLVRRVLDMRELGIREAVLRGGGDASATVGIQVAVNGARVSGYRLLAFYP